jgi:hypothetical protein
VITNDVWPPVRVAGHFDLTGQGSCEAADAAEVPGAVVDVARKWCVDRALRPPTVAVVGAVVEEATCCAQRAGAEALSLTMWWVDLDQVRIELEWHGCGVSALAAEQQPSAGRFARLAGSRGIEPAGANEARQWFDVDTRPPD